MPKKKFKVGDLVLVVGQIGNVPHNSLNKVGRITHFMREEFTYSIGVSGDRMKAKEFNEKELLKLDNKLAKLFFT